MVTPRQYVAAPAAAPLPFGLMAAALLVPETDGHLGAVGFEYETTRCGNAHSTLAPCQEDEADALLTDDGYTLVTGEPFVVYALHRCNNIGGKNPTDAAREKLDRGEWRGIEEGFADNVLARFAVDLTPTPGTPIHPVDGLGVLEEHAASLYDSVPVIHTARRVGTHLGQLGAITRVSNRLETVQGAVVASGAGYVAATTGAELFTQAQRDDEDFDPETDTGTTPGDGERWLFVTGTVMVRRSEVIMTDPHQAQVFAPDDTEEEGPRTFNNVVQVLAQRPVAASAECVVAAVLVTETAVAP